MEKGQERYSESESERLDRETVLPRSKGTSSPPSLRLSLLKVLLY